MKSLIRIVFLILNLSVLVSFSTADSRVLLNAEHVPSREILTDKTMRDPLNPTEAGSINLYLGVQPLGAMTSGQIWYRIDAGSWNSETLTFHSSEASLDYWAGSIPFQVGEFVEYYLEGQGTGYETTFIYGNDSVSFTTSDQGTAQTGAFSFTSISTPTPTPSDPSATPTSLPSSTPTASPNTPTPYPPTNTPSVPTSTPSAPTITPSPSPSATPTPTITPSPTPGLSPTPTEEFELNLKLSQRYFVPRDRFYLSVDFYNRTSRVVSGDLYVILDVYSQFFFHPSWKGTLDFEVQPEIVPHASQPTTYVILDFPWPEEEVNTVDGILFFAAMFSPGTLELMGNFDRVEFGYTN